jgi:hypothetical protein
MRNFTLWRDACYAHIEANGVCVATDLPSDVKTTSGKSFKHAPSMRSVSFLLKQDDRFVGSDERVNGRTKKVFRLKKREGY